MSDLIQTAFEERVIRLESVIAPASFKLPIMVSTWNLDPQSVEKTLIKRASMIEFVHEHNKHNDSSYNTCHECDRVANYNGRIDRAGIEAFLNDHIALIAEMKLERERGRR